MNWIRDSGIYFNTLRRTIGILLSHLSESTSPTTVIRAQHYLARNWSRAVTSELLFWHNSNQVSCMLFSYDVLCSSSWCWEYLPAPSWLASFKRACIFASRNWFISTVSPSVIKKIVSFSIFVLWCAASTPISAAAIIVYPEHMSRTVLTRF